MLLPLIFVLAAVVHLTSALPAYDNHVAVKPILASQFCILPDEFVVKNFDIFFLAADNNRTAFINFEYSNENTWIKTKCQYNETSVNVDPKGHAQRYACENKPANFTWWRNGTLTIYERSCPLEDKFKANEYVGSVTPNLRCSSTSGAFNGNTMVGAGSLCDATKALSALFTSQQSLPDGKAASRPQ